MRRLLVVVLLAMMVTAMSAGAAFAGEITGNGKVLKQADGTLHGRSECAYSGQEDLQFLDENGVPLPEGEVVKGEPAHAQSWGQIPKDFRDFLSTIGAHPGQACNPNIGEPGL